MGCLPSPKVSTVAQTPPAPPAMQGADELKLGTDATNPAGANSKAIGRLKLRVGPKQ